MAMTVESLSESPNLNFNVKGDLGDLHVDTIDSDNDEDETSDKRENSRVSTLSNIPSGLVKPSNVPVFGHVAVTNSDNVQFGNNTYFNGPVIIKQIIQSKSGVENVSYTPTDDDGTNGGISATFTEKPTEQSLQKIQILVRHKITLSAIGIMTVIGGIVAVVLVLQNKHDDNVTNSGDFDTSTNISADTPVIGYCYENIQAIIITIMLPLTFLISYLLLTRDTGNPANCIEKSTLHENCLVKSCTTCNNEGDPLVITPGHLRIVSRTDWLAQPVEKSLTTLRLPVPYVIIAHTATESCFTQSQCVLRVRLIQTFHIESRGWNDIGYNFLIGGDGSVYYGRGWDFEGAHTKYYNKYSIGIALIGTFNTEIPTKRQMDACEKLINLGVSLGKIARNYYVIAHRQLMSTLSPGDTVVDIIKSWPHFANDTDRLGDMVSKIGY